MSFKVAMPFKLADVPESFSKRVAESGAEFFVRDATTDNEKIELCHDADFVVTIFSLYPFNKTVIERLEKAKFLETLGIGYDRVDVLAATEHGIGVIQNPGFCREELSDHAMALMLACSRWIMGLHSRVKIGNPVGRASLEAMERMIILRGKTLGLVGFGNSARALVPKARGFGMRLITYDPYVDVRASEELQVQKVKLEQLLEESDFISIHANLTPGNRHLIGLNELKKMKPTAFIINTSRGGLIDESDLCIALSKGYLAGAGLDVTDPDPPPKDSPLLKFDNVICTGHNAGSSPQAYASMWDFPIQQIVRVMNRQWPKGLVNPEVKTKHIAKWGPPEPGEDSALTA